MTAYTYNSTDTLNNIVNTGSIWLSVKESTITTILKSVLFENNIITINFDEELSSDELTTLNTIISTHEGIPIP